MEYRNWTIFPDLSDTTVMWKAVRGRKILDPSLTIKEMKVKIDAEEPDRDTIRRVY